LEGIEKAAAGSHARCADEMVRTIFASMDQFATQTDDATVLALRVH
jgi:hypothetical protein